MKFVAAPFVVNALGFENPIQGTTSQELIGNEIIISVEHTKLCPVCGHTDIDTVIIVTHYSIEYV